jgi:hypothetical protein
MNNNFQDRINKLNLYSDIFNLISYYNEYWKFSTRENIKIINYEPTYYSNENKKILSAYSYILLCIDNNNII